MAYLDVISLADAKLHLRVDDTLADDDAAITRMISTALSFVENWTSHFVYAREKTYIMVDGFVRVYDTPINSITTVDGNTVVEADDMDNEQKTLYKNFCYGIETVDMVLNVGYTTNVPQALIDVALEIIDIMYYGNETGKTVQKDLSPMSIMQLDQLKRF